ncbi:MAG: group I intron-associated PD-(D/E)XK endonuclease [Candidatus Sulfotelmatobacter sp.]
MKNRQNLGCRIKDPKERGAAELYFMALAAGQGLKVSNPYGGFASYDVGVEDAGPILRVQVKCTMSRHAKGGYSLNIRGPKYRGYPRGTVDFFALYIIPTDDWYTSPMPSSGEDTQPCTSPQMASAKSMASITRLGTCFSTRPMHTAKGRLRSMPAARRRSQNQSARAAMRTSALQKMFQTVFRKE